MKNHYTIDNVSWRRLSLSLSHIHNTYIYTHNVTCYFFTDLSVNVDCASPCPTRRGLALCSRLSQGAPCFDFEKLNVLNQHYIKEVGQGISTNSSGGYTQEKVA